MHLTVAQQSIIIYVGFTTVIFNRRSYDIIGEEF